ncbi:MAG TPA: hypothetical protein VMU01_09365 [Rhizomicrobium sp.]|nr:hypothetical protein [Rhizomicrobium sp.]
MPEILRRGVLAGLAVAGVFAAYLFVAAAYVELDLAQPPLVSPAALKVVFSSITLIFLSGVLPSVVLNRLRIRSIWPFFLAGALSGVLTIYAWLFVFAQTFTLFGGEPQAPPLGTLLLREFSQLPGLVAETPEEQLGAVSGVALAGLVCGGLFWLAFVWWPTRRAASRRRT